LTEEELSLFRLFALQNAVKFGGKAKLEAVIGKIMANMPDLRGKSKEISPIVSEIIEEVNSMSIEEQKRLLETYPRTDASAKAKTVERKLPPLPNVENYDKVHVRFCPNPDGALHLGSARAAILCDEYAKMYGGIFTLRFDDTDPKTKSPIPDAYEWIRQDLKWLGVKWNNEVYQSDRLEFYYKYAAHLITDGKAYVCSCPPTEFKRLVVNMKACPCRGLPPTEHLRRWGMMMDGGYLEGEAVVRIKTDLEHPNPAVRDWPALRIIDVLKFPHPRVGSRYRVWPLFAFCCGIDDHDLGISHVIRGKEHLTNSVRQTYLYKHMGWRMPEAMHYGRLKITGAVLSKSKTREGIEKGVYAGWDDPRLGTLMALRRRGFLPDAIRRLMLEVGPKPVDATISWDNIESMNRKLLDPLANRYFFVAEPATLLVKGVRKTYNIHLPLHPSRPDNTVREFKIVPENGEASLLVSSADVKKFAPGKIVRLMGLFNIEIENVGKTAIAKYLGDSYQEARVHKAPLIQWVPAKQAVEAKVIMPDNKTVVGRAEYACLSLKPGERVQFERFGFVRIESADKCLTAYYTHR
jgi:glutamyl-tRNA synthetase